VSRLATGLIASVIGTGFLAAGLVTITLPAKDGTSHTLAVIVEECGHEPITPPVGQKTGTTIPQAPSGVTAASPQKSAEGWMILSKIEGFFSAIGRFPGNLWTFVSEDIPKRFGKTAATPYCHTGGLLVLMAVAMLFGFSERALTSFEDKILPASK
jgi:hypothetical protein